MITIHGAGGAIGNELVKLLAARETTIQTRGSHSKSRTRRYGNHSADLSDKEQTFRAVAGSSIVHLLVGLKYDHKLWAEMWPRIMANTIEACKRVSAGLIFFDNVYMYGKVRGPMTEEMPFNPAARKGRSAPRSPLRSSTNGRLAPSPHDCTCGRLLRTRQTQWRAEYPSVRAIRQESESVVAR